MTMAMIEGASYPSAKEQRATFVSAIENVHEQVATLANQLGDITDRLCGGTPPTDNAPSQRGINAVPNGIFDSLNDRAADMSTKLERIRDCIRRIERALP